MCENNIFSPAEYGTVLRGIFEDVYLNLYFPFYKIKVQVMYRGFVDYSYRVNIAGQKFEYEKSG